MMSYEPISEWTDNTGAVPSDITADTVLELRYRDKTLVVLDPHSRIVAPSNIAIWKIFYDVCDIIQYRKMKRG